jgi:uncharacterized protein
MTNILFILIGLAAGVLAGMFGIGGGVLIVPALILLTKMSPQSATGTSLAALLLPVGALGAWAYYKEGYVRAVPATWITLGLFVGVYFGARIALQMSSVTLQRAFSVFLAVVAVRMWFGK